jgi:hypothetical protein
VSYVNHHKIEVYKSRASDDSWKEVSELVSLLPFPAAVALALYVCETDSRQLGELVLDFTEAALTLGAYVAYLEMCSADAAISSKHFKGFSKRSAGPLWGLLKTCLGQMGKNAGWSKPYSELMEPHFEFDEFVDCLAQVKHKKKSINEIDHEGYLFRSGTPNRLWFQGQSAGADRTIAL